MKRALIVATIGGFLPVSEINNARLLQKLGYEVHYAANMNNRIYEYDEQKLIDEGFILHHVEFSKNPFHFKRLAKSIKEVREIIKEFQIEVVHCHTPVGGVVGRLSSCLVKENRPKVIYTAHGFHFYEGAPLLNWLLYYPVEYLLSGITDCIVTINKEDFARAKRMRAKQVVQIPGVGIDLERFHPVERQTRKTFYIISIGELNKNKNHRTIIKALAKLRDRGIFYEIYGNGPDRDSLLQMIKDYQLEQQVFLRGFEIEIEKKLNDADCCIFPSIREGLGLAALEAMACGIPLIASDNRGTREYMQHNINGIVCNPLDEDAFARAIVQMKGNRPFAEHMAEIGLQTVQAFSVEKSTSIMRELYEKI